VRAVLDVNVLIAGLLSRTGTPARLIRYWLVGAYELVVSEALLEELERALGYRRVRARIPEERAKEFVALVRAEAVLVAQPASGTHRSADPGDDYLLALAESGRAILVSGDAHLLQLADELPIRSPRDFAHDLDQVGAA
jgi:uncharacterized protein